MNIAELQKRDPAKNMARPYRIWVAPTLNRFRNSMPKMYSLYSGASMFRAGRRRHERAGSIAG